MAINDTEIDMIEKYESELETLKCLQMMDSSDKVITIVYSLKEPKGEAIITKGFTKPEIEARGIDSVKIRGHNQLLYK